MSLAIRSNAIRLSAHKSGVSLTVALGACRTLVELGIKLRETSDFVERLAALEGKAADESNPKIASRPIGTRGGHER